MDAGLVTAMSGALAQSKRVDIIANNLANADTPSFKADDLTFEESLIDAHQKDTRSDIPEQPAKDSELFSRSGDERRTVLYGGEYTDLKAGAVRATGNSLDIAIEGNGFLEVLTPKGIRLTRAGNLALDPQGRLTTRDGFLVLGPGNAARPQAPAATATLNPQAAFPEASSGAEPDAEQAVRAITVGVGKLNIDLEGNLYVGEKGGALVGKLGLVQVENPKALVKEGGNLFLAKPEAFIRPMANAPGRGPASETTASVATKPNPLGPTTTAPRVHQGMLESSNVNPVGEMTKMIEAHRLFDQNTKLMQVQGDMLGRVSEIGKF